eukprot:TCONS_00042001-protein
MLKLKMEKISLECVFHLANQKATYELNLATNGEKLHFEKNPVYLSVTLDNILSFNQHPTNVFSKVTKYTAIFFKILVVAAEVLTSPPSAQTTLALCYSTAEFCLPIWSHNRPL